jgi:hypothetical protein
VLLHFNELGLFIEIISAEKKKVNSEQEQKTKKERKLLIFLSNRFSLFCSVVKSRFFHFLFLLFSSPSFIFNNGVLKKI